VSFTTEAARRLRREVARLLGDRASDVAIYTLHALGRHVIDTWSVRLGYDDRPSVLHHQEARALFAATAESLGWDLESIPVDEVMNAADRCRLLADSEARETDPLAQLASAYEDRLRRHGAIDFVAMLSLPLRLFEAHEQALRVLQDAYQCVLADESQDLDPRNGGWWSFSPPGMATSWSLATTPNVCSGGGVLITARCGASSSDIQTAR
jgi:superfamily I DNA/RNA helicase